MGVIKPYYIEDCCSQSPIKVSYLREAVFGRHPSLAITKDTRTIQFSSVEIKIYSTSDAESLDMR